MAKKIKISLISPIMSLSEEMARITKQMIHDVREGMNAECELVIVDNASTHGMEHMKEGADIYVRLPENRGWGGGINVGMKLASGDYFVFVNNDITLSQTGWAEKLVARFESKAKIGTISMNGRGGFSGAFFAIRKEIYEKIGGFDEEGFPLGHAQDCDYLYRLMYEGWDDNVLLIDGYRHYGRKTYNQKDFKDKYLTTKNFSKSDFIQKWGFKEQEWEKKGHVHWRERIEKDPSLDRYNELKDLQ